MRHGLATMLLCGCGSFGLDPAAEYAGGLWVQPQGATDFGELLPDEQRAARQFKLSSEDEDYGVQVVDLWVEGDTGAFALAFPPELPRALEPGDRMGVTVKFTPADSGNFGGALVIETADGVRTRRALTGKGCRNRDGNRRCD